MSGKRMAVSAALAAAVAVAAPQAHAAGGSIGGIDWECKSKGPVMAPKGPYEGNVVGTKYECTTPGGTITLVVRRSTF